MIIELVISHCRYWKKETADVYGFLGRNFPFGTMVVGNIHLAGTHESHIFGGRLISLGTIIESVSGGRA